VYVRAVPCFWVIGAGGYCSAGHSGGLGVTSYEGFMGIYHNDGTLWGRACAFEHMRENGPNVPV
jgi:hypothetical protein